MGSELITNTARHYIAVFSKNKVDNTVSLNTAV